MKKLLLALALLCGAAFAQTDIQINQIGPYITLGKQVTWVGSGPGGFNNNYIFTPTIPDQGLCIFVRNHDTGAHTFSLGVSSTGDQSVNTYQNNTASWTGAQGQGTLAFYTVGGSGSVSAIAATFVKTSGAARVAVTFSGGSGAGTVSTFVVYTTAGGCTAQAYPYTVALNLFASQAFNTTQANVASACITNPGAGKVILALNGVPGAAGQTQFIDLQRIVLSSSVAVQYAVNEITDAGTTCTATSAVNSSSTPTTRGATAIPHKGTCVTDPTIRVNGVVETGLNLAANAPLNLDMQGFWFPTNSTNGFDITTPAGATGSVCASIYWIEY